MMKWHERRIYETSARIYSPKGCKYNLSVMYGISARLWHFINFKKGKI